MVLRLIRLCLPSSSTTSPGPRGEGCGQGCWLRVASRGGVPHRGPGWLAEGQALSLPASLAAARRAFAARTAAASVVMWPSRTRTCASAVSRRSHRRRSQAFGGCGADQRLSGAARRLPGVPGRALQGDGPAQPPRAGVRHPPDVTTADVGSRSGATARELRRLVALAAVTTLALVTTACAR